MRQGSKGAISRPWFFSVVPGLDLDSALFGARTHPVYGIVLTCVVPLLIVNQVMIVVGLARG